MTLPASASFREERHNRQHRLIGKATESTWSASSRPVMPLGPWHGRCKRRAGGPILSRLVPQIARLRDRLSGP